MLSSWTRLLALGLLAASGVRAVVLGEHAQAMFDEAMAFQDQIYDADAGYLYYFYYPLAAGPHETRSSIWYAAGLLQRDCGRDRDEAVKIIRNVIAGQETNTSAQWYGDYTVYPEQPTVGSAAYAPDIYNSWDPNWRGFIGTALIVIYEEFGALLPADVQALILESLRHNTVGDSYRVGGVDDDNLYPAYSNAWLMRTVVTSWTGARLGDANMTAAGDADARAFFDLFDRNGTLSEFGGPTYAGVSLYALTVAAKYLGGGGGGGSGGRSVIGQNAARAVAAIWTTEATLWNANLRNLAGPWDRSYGFDMNRYVAIMGAWVWALAGRGAAWTQRNPVATLAHADDFQLAPLLAVLAPFHATLVPAAARAELAAFSGERTYHGTAYAPPADAVPRNLSAWLSANLTIGAASFRQTVVGGFSKDPTSFSPAVVQWLRPGGSVGYLSLHPAETALQADVEPYRLRLAYPLGNASSTFTFVLAANPLGAARDIASLADVDGLSIAVVGGSVDPVPHFSFCGLVGGTCSIVHNFEFWNVTFAMPANSTETPSIELQFAL